MGFTQESKEKAKNIKDKYEQSQPQDFSVPPPPINTFPSQFPKGNKVFLQKINENIDKNLINNLSVELKTKIILKIDPNGNVVNISTYGKDETFNNMVKNAAKAATDGIKWIPGKNKLGKNVIDIVSLPFDYK